MRPSDQPDKLPSSQVEETQPAPPTRGVPPLLWALQSITLVGVIGSIFAAGIWKGQIDTKIEELRRAQDRQTQSSDKLSDRINEINTRLAKIEGKLEAVSVSPRKSAWHKNTRSHTTLIADTTPSSRPQGSNR